MKGISSVWVKNGNGWISPTRPRAGIKGVGERIVFPPLTVDMTGINNCEGLGDSLMVGTIVTASKRFLTKFGADHNLTVDNLAVGGRGFWRAHNEIKGKGYTRSQTVLAVVVGLNDMKRGGMNPKTFSKVNACMRTIISKHIVSNIVASGSASVTRTGTMIGFNALSVGGYFTTGTPPGNFATRPNAAGAGTWTYAFTLTQGQMGVNVIMSASDNVTITGYGTGSIWVDDNFVTNVDLRTIYDGISDVDDNNTRGPLSFQFFGLNAGAHTIKVVANGDGFFPVDCFNIIDSLSSQGAMIFAEIPYNDTRGYKASGADKGTRQYSVEYSRLIYNNVLEYRALGFNIGFINTNSYINLGAGMDSDGTHWNDHNNELMTDAFNSIVRFRGKPRFSRKS